MSPNCEPIFEAALALPDPDRFELVEALIASMQPEDRAPFDESWREIIKRRSDEIRSGKVVGIPWAEVKRQTREHIGG